MLSHRLIQCIEDHSEQLTDEVIRRIRMDPELTHIGQLPTSDLHEWRSGLLRNLGAWLAGEERGKLRKHYEEIGKERFDGGIPLHECVRSLHILKQEIVDFARNQGFAQSSVEIYAEEELERRVDRFIDFLLYHLVRGYEAALRGSKSVAAVTH
jgi:hypothetical protein